MGTGPNYGLPLRPYKKKVIYLNWDNRYREVVKKHYELTDHLSNVRTVFSDKRMADADLLAQQPVSDF